MNPRKLSSKKWTAFPGSYLEQIRLLFEKEFSSALKKGDFYFDGRVYQEEVLFQAGYLEKGRLSQSNFEVSLDSKPGVEGIAENIHLCVDLALHLMADYFEFQKKKSKSEDFESEDNLDLPYLWKEIEFQKNTFFIQFSTENSSLEAEANRLLGEFSEAMVHEDNEDSEDALFYAEKDKELNVHERNS